MSQDGDQNPTAAERQVMREGEEVEIFAGMANQSTEVETLRTELLNANRKINELTLRLLGNEETPGGGCHDFTCWGCPAGHFCSPTDGLIWTRHVDQWSSFGLLATVDKTVDKPVGKCVILRCHQLIMSGACSMTSRHELCSGYCLVETWDSCKLSPECMEMDHHSLAKK